jgi:hypothetical protein
VSDMNRRVAALRGAPSGTKVCCGCGSTLRGNLTCLRPALWRERTMEGGTPRAAQRTLGALFDDAVDARKVARRQQLRLARARSEARLSAACECAARRDTRHWLCRALRTPTAVICASRRLASSASPVAGASVGRKGGFAACRQRKKSLERKTSTRASPSTAPRASGPVRARSQSAALRSGSSGASPAAWRVGREGQGRRLC